MNYYYGTTKHSKTINNIEIGLYVALGLLFIVASVYALSTMLGEIVGGMA